MSINAIVSSVKFYENGGGELLLSGEERGQQKLVFGDHPEDVSCLTGRQIWGGAGSIMLGETEIAKRDGYVGIEFTIDSFAGLLPPVDLIQNARSTNGLPPSGGRDAH